MYVRHWEKAHRKTPYRYKGGCRGRRGCVAKAWALLESTLRPGSLEHKWHQHGLTVPWGPGSASLFTSPPCTPGFPLTEIRSPEKEAARGSAGDGSTDLVEGHVCSPGQVYYTSLSFFPHPLPSASSTLHKQILAA